MDISDDEFDKIISQAMDELPEEYIKNLNNVAITYADEPTHEQRQKQKLRDDQNLLGLYEGIPLTKRGSGYSMVLPDKITIFKSPIIRSSHDMATLMSHVKHTLWHEIAHHYGLGHDQIRNIEQNWK